MRNFKHPYSKKTLDKTVNRLLNEILSVAFSHHADYLSVRNGDHEDGNWSHSTHFHFNVLSNVWQSSQHVLSKQPFEVSIQVLGKDLFEYTHLLNRDWKVNLILFKEKIDERISIRFPKDTTHSWLCIEIDDFNASFLPNRVTSLVRVQSSRYERLAYICSNKYINKALAFPIREVDEQGFKMSNKGWDINKDTIITEQLSYTDLEQMTADELYIRLHVFKRDKHEDGVDSILVPFRDYLQMLYWKGGHNKHTPIPTFHYQDDNTPELSLDRYTDPTIQYNCHGYSGDGQSVIKLDEPGHKAECLYPMMQDQIHTALLRHHGVFMEQIIEDRRPLITPVVFDFTTVGTWDYQLTNDQLHLNIVSNNAPNGDLDRHMEVESFITDSVLQTIKLNDELLELGNSGKLVQLSGLTDAYQLILKKDNEYHAYSIDPLNNFCKAFSNSEPLTYTLNPICPQFDTPTPLYVEISIGEDNYAYVHLVEYLSQRISHVQMKAYVATDGFERTDVEFDHLLVSATVGETQYEVNKEYQLINQLRQMEHNVIQYRKLLVTLLEDGPIPFVDTVKAQILSEIRKFESHPSSKEKAFIGIGNHDFTFYSEDGSLSVYFHLMEDKVNELIKLPYLNYPFLSHSAVEPKYIVKLNNNCHFIIESDYTANENLTSASVSTQIYSYFDLDVNSVTYQLGHMTDSPFQFLPVKDSNNVGNHYVSCTSLDDGNNVFIRLDVFIGMLLALPKVNTNDIV